MTGKTRMLGIVGSPRRKGNTHLLVEQVLEGAREAGAETDLVFLDEQVIRECDGCHVCWKGNPCSKDDDMNELYDRIAENDILVLGTPVYWYGPTALMKGFIDRFVYFNCPENRVLLAGKVAILAVPFEEDDPAAADLLVKFFERSLDYLGIRLLGMVLAPGVTRPGEIRERREILERGAELGRAAVTGLDR
jgi:multimeric flavodoxin WrbA